MGFDKIRVNFVAGYSSPDLSGDTTFEEMLEQADDALQRAATSATDYVVCFDDEPEVDEPAFEIAEHDIEVAFEHILKGNFYQIPEEYLSAVVERLTPFMQYVENQTEDDHPVDQAEKNVAV